MTEQELRALVRQAVAFHVGGRQVHAAPALPRALAGEPHTSHAMFTLPASPGGACVIEPAVDCNHCGFCKSYGH